MLRSTLLTAVALGASSAMAASYTTLPGAPDPGPLASETWVLDYDTPVPASVTITGDYQIVQGSLSGIYAAPAGDSSFYFSSPGSTSSGWAEIWVADWLPAPVSTFSFYWGSADTYNTLELLDLNGNVFFSVTGSDISSGAGDTSDPNQNLRIYFTLGLGEQLGGLRFNSTNYAFEHDDLAFGVVPEPATWAMLILGFGLVGMTVRRRKAIVAC